MNEFNVPSNLGSNSSSSGPISFNTESESNFGYGGGYDRILKKYALSSSGS